VNTGIFARQ